jgi:hypothetical protein
MPELPEITQHRLRNAESGGGIRDTTYSASAVPKTPLIQLPKFPKKLLFFLDTADVVPAEDSVNIFLT